MNCPMYTWMKNTYGWFIVHLSVIHLTFMALANIGKNTQYVSEVGLPQHSWMGAFLMISVTGHFGWWWWGGDSLHWLKVYFLCRCNFQAVSRQSCTGNKLRILWTLCAMNLRSSKRTLKPLTVPLWWRTGLIIFVSWQWIVQLANACEVIWASILLLFSTVVYLVYFTMNMLSVCLCGLTGE